MLRVFSLVLLLPSLATAQALQATHVHSGLDATSARTRLERGSPRQYGPRFEAAAMRLESAVEDLPALRVPGQKEALRREVSPIRLVRPAFRLPERDLGIADRYDVLFFAEARLVRFRIHLKAAGEPLAKRWAGQLRSYFDFLDRDGDGVLNRYEAEYAFSNAGVGQMLQTGYAYQRPDDAARMFADLDQDEDGKVSFDEFAAHYAPSANRVIATQAGVNRDAAADALTDELFRLLDTDRDGKLSKAELQGVERLFATLDADEDECLSMDEVRGSAPARTGPPPTPRQAPMSAFRPGQAPEGLANTILARYDRDKNLRLSRSENPFSDEAFRKLDRNGDGELSVTELARWADQPPDLELEMTLGGKPEECVLKLLPGPDGKPAALAAGFKPAGPGAGVFTIGNQTVHLGCYAPRGVYAQPTGRASPLVFADGGRGYITEGNIAGPQFQAMRVLFDLIDRDADGRITRAEFDAFANLQRSFLSLPLSLVYAAQTPSLFQLMDANGDGRLSMREVRTAWDRLIALEPVEKEHVTRAALTPQGGIRFGRVSEMTVAANSPGFVQPPGVRQSGRGPAWFRKFDRNGDGELSRSEFPGRQEDFDRMDTDHDGVISVEEAEAADKKMRAGK